MAGGQLGRVAALSAGVLFTFTPTYLYFSRFAREDIYIAAITLGLVVAIAVGSALAALFLDWDVSRGFRTVIIAHVMFQVSFVALTVRARVRGFDWTLEQAAQDLGASPLRTFWKVTFPLILPGILAAALLSFALSFDDFIITNFNSGNVTTFPKFVYVSAARGIPAQANVIGTAMFVVALLVVLIGQVVGRRRRV